MNMMLSRVLRASFLVSLSVLLTAGSGSREKAPAGDFENHPLYKTYAFSSKETVIEIGVPTPWATVGHIVEVMQRDAILKDELRALGYSVVFHPFLKGEEINYFMRKNVLEGSIIGDMPTLLMAAEGRITVMSLVHKGKVSLVSRHVYRIRDLKGKRVAYPFLSIAHYYLMKILSEKGMAEGDIKHVPMDTRDMLDAIGKREIDAFTTFEPTASVYTRIDPTLHTIHRSFLGYGFFNIRKEYGRRHPKAVRAIVAAQFRAMAWLRLSDRNLNKASRWVAREAMKMTPLPFDRHTRTLDTLCAEDLLNDVNRYRQVLNGEVLADNGEVREEFEFLKTKGYIPAERGWHDVRNNFDVQAVHAVLKDTKEYVARVAE